LFDKWFSEDIQVFVEKSIVCDRREPKTFLGIDVFLGTNVP